MITMESEIRLRLLVHNCELRTGKDAPSRKIDAAGWTEGRCGLQIVSGVPINYGQVTAGQASADKQVTIKNEGYSPATIL